MTTLLINAEKKKCLQNIYKSKNMSTKLMWQNVYFWWLKNEDRLRR